MRAAWMRAGDREFRFRYLIFAGIFFLGFQFYAVDHVPAGIAVAQWIARRPLDTALPRDRHLLQTVYAVAALLVLLAAALRTWAAAYLRSDVVHAPVLHTGALVAEGPYRHTRNPLYVGGILLGAGIGMEASRMGFLFIVAAIILFQYRLIFREEGDLFAMQGDSYSRYVRAVPRLWPSLRAKLPSGGAHPAWGQAWVGEAFFWLFAASSVAWAATLSQRVLMIGTTIAVIAGAVIGAAVGKRKSGTPALP